MTDPEAGRPSILIVRLSAIGDIVFASPLVHALRRRYPGARISWLVQPESRSLLECHPELDEVIVWPRGEWQRLWKARRWRELWRVMSAFRALLHSRHFDLALDVQGLLKSGLLTWFSGARERIGLASREGSRWLMTRVIERGGEPRRIASEYLHFAWRLELPTAPFEMCVGLDEADRRQAGEWVRRQGLERGFVVICPFTTRPQKHWFDASWQRLAERIGAEWGLSVVMLGGPGDRRRAREIAAGAPRGVIDLAGETTLRQAAAIIANASLVIGVDTGLTHIGIAMERPTLCLFGSTRPYLETGHANARVIYHPRECSPCRRNPTCGGGFHCMADITVEEVMDEAARLLGFRESPP